MAFVSRGEALLGIVYETDAKVDKGVEIIGTFPADSHPGDHLSDRAHGHQQSAGCPGVPGLREVAGRFRRVQEVRLLRSPHSPGLTC